MSRAYYEDEVGLPRTKSSRKSADSYHYERSPSSASLPVYAVSPPSSGWPPAQRGPTTHESERRRTKPSPHYPPPTSLYPPSPRSTPNDSVRSGYLSPDVRRSDTRPKHNAHLRRASSPGRQRPAGLPPSPPASLGALSPVNSRSSQRSSPANSSPDQHLLQPGSALRRSVSTRSPSPDSRHLSMSKSLEPPRRNTETNPNKERRPVWFMARKLKGAEIQFLLTVSLERATLPANMHWAVRVGPWLHELGSNANGHKTLKRARLYENEIWKPDLARVVATTTMTDRDIDHAARGVLYEMQEKNHYHYSKNNCQHFTTRLLQEITGRKKLLGFTTQEQYDKSRSKEIQRNFEGLLLGFEGLDLSLLDGLEI